MKYKPGYYRPANGYETTGDLLYCDGTNFYAFGWDCELKPNESDSGCTNIRYSEIGEYLGESL